MDTYDHYFEAKIIAGGIEESGFGIEAKNIRAAIENGRSGTEIFMQLKYYLVPLLERELPKELACRIQILLSKIDHALSI